MAETEQVVAVVPQPAGTRTEDEMVLAREVSDIELRAEAVVIENDDDYRAAGEFGVTLKTKAAEVMEFFKPMKDLAYKAHKSVCDREKAVLAPLKSAEATLKKAMGAYSAEKERKRREEEAAVRRAAEAERERQLQKAVELEEQGDADGAEAAMMDAEVMDQAAAYSIQPAAAQQKVQGVSTSKDWEIVSVDEKAVPAYIAGVELRPVNKGAVMRMIRASKGSVEIPGVQYREIVKTSFRRN